MNKREFLLKLYNILFANFGEQHWWPGESRDEIIIGAILTQNTSWHNVEKTISNLKKHNCLSLNCIYGMSVEELYPLIKSSGFYRRKAITLKSVSDFITNNFDDSTFDNPLHFREKLLSINGIGDETADSILLYAFDIPLFVVDVYTKRILLRHGIVRENAGYASIQSLFHSNLPLDAKLYNEYHALIVKLGKEFCSKEKPKCDLCPIKKGGL